MTVGLFSPVPVVYGLMEVFPDSYRTGRSFIRHRSFMGHQRPFGWARQKPLGHRFFWSVVI